MKDALSRDSLHLALGALLALAACRPGEESLPIIPPPDAGAPADAARRDTAPPPPSGPPSAVTGAQTGNFFNELGMRQNQTSYVNAKVAAWSLSPDGQYKYFGGMGMADGRFAVPDVPAGPFLLRVYNDFFAASTKREFDLSYFTSGRPERSFTTRPTPLTVSLSGLATWQTGDELHFYVPAANGGDSVLHTRLMVPVAPGATGITGAVDYATFNTPVLPDGPGRGDETWIVQRSYVPSDQVGIRTLIIKKFFRTKDLKVVDGQPAMLSATLVDAPPATTVAIDWPVPEWAPLAGSVSPVAGRMRGSYILYTIPGGERFGDYGWAGPLLYIPVTGTTLPALKVVARYSDPYPTTWGPYAGAYIFFTVPVLIPGGMAPGEVTGRIFVNDSVANFAAGPIRPIVTPPREPKINDKSAFTEQVGVTTTPVVSWAAPAVGKPSLYKIFVLHGRVFDGRVSLPTIAALHTEDTSIRLPPDLLQFGESYVLVIEALLEGDVSVNKPFQRAQKRGFAQLVTARFTP